jgi:hypothetical protein
MNIRSHHVSHCVHENLAAKFTISGPRRNISGGIPCELALISIGTIKLRSPAFAAAARGSARRRHGAHGSKPARFPHCGAPLSLRCNIIPGRRANDPGRRNGPALTPRGASQIPNFPGNTWQNSYAASPRNGPAQAAPASRPSASGSTAARSRRRLKSPCRTPFSAPPDTAYVIPIPAKPADHPAAKPIPAIARPARGVNVGLTVNREDHVTKIPVVFVRRPPQSGE